MSFITTSVKERLLAERAEVFFVSGAATKWWNRQRTDKKHEIALLGGYYWTLNGEEAGPFRTPSAAWRDVYYRKLLEQDPPCMDKKDLARVHRELKKSPPAERRPRLNSVTGTVVRLRA
jgi:hypothetical protein